MVFLVMCTRNPIIFGSAQGLGICDEDFSLDKNHNGEIRKQISEMNPQLLVCFIILTQIFTQSWVFVVMRPSCSIIPLHIAHSGLCWVGGLTWLVATILRWCKWCIVFREVIWRKKKGWLFVLLVVFLLLICPHTLCGGMTLFSFQAFKRCGCCCDLITNQIILLYGGVDYHFVGHEKSVVV